VADLASAASPVSVRMAVGEVGTRETREFQLGSATRRVFGPMA